MELTVNTFLKGLLTDIHPMVQGNDVLSDALNATFVTMNGNEIILQNDMGNRRIDNAFLPPGYEPVGIKEYGGIIYVAAYNPLTNMSLVGSFPSPERKISASDIKTSNGTWNTESHFNNNFVKTDSILIPLTAENALHVGDKFVVYSDLSGIKNSISNYGNIAANGKVASPKNKEYTLALGILNSRNEFVDITKSLVRWENGKIMDLEEKSDLYKFNAGYFIPNSFTNPTLDYTKNDAELIRQRLVIEANTYSYKLVGPLYLKATFNHMLELNYNIYGNVVKTNGLITKANISVEVFITYNCPDYINVNSNIGDDNYDNYQIGTVTGDGFFTFTNGNQFVITGDGGTIRNSSTTKNVYNPETNLYLIKIIKDYTFDSFNGGTGNFLYALGALAKHGDNNVIIPSLSVKGTLDLNKLGSGIVELKGWRFYNYEGITKLTYIFDSYPKYGHSFKNLEFKFTDVNDSSNVITINDNLPIYNGKNTIEIDWNKVGILERKLYKVDIKFEEYDENDTKVTNSDLPTFVRWFLSTPLMNDCYNSTSNFFIKDFGNPDASLTGQPQTLEEKNLDYKLSIKVKTNLNITDNSNPEYSLIPYNNKKWFEKYLNVSNLPDIEIRYKHKYNLNLSLNPKLEIIDEYLFPDYITSVNVPSNNLSIKGILKKENNLINVTFKGNYGDDNTPVKLSLDEYKLLQDGSYNLKNNTECHIQANNNIIKKELSFLDALISLGSNSGSIEYPFGDALEYFSKSISFLDDQNNPQRTIIPFYLGIGVTWDSRGGGHRDIKYLNVFSAERIDIAASNKPSQVDMAYSDENAYIDVKDDAKKYRYEILSSSSDSDVDYPNDEAPEQILKIKDHFSDIPSTSVITYIFHTYKDSMMASTTTRNSTRGTKDIYTNARVYWRKTTGEWAMFNSFLTRTKDSNDGPNSYYSILEEDTNLYNFIKTNIFKNQDLIYCFSDSINFSDIKTVHVSDDYQKIKYNKEYNILIPLYIEYKISDYTLEGNGNKNVECRNGSTPAKKIEFKKSNDLVTNTLEHTININSLEDFLDKVSKMTKGKFTNIEISTGNNLDNKGNLLSPANFYSNDNGTFVLKEMEGLEISPNFGRNGYNTILYSKDSKEIFSYNYDISGWDDRNGLASINYYKLGFDKVVL